MIILSDTCKSDILFVSYSYIKKVMTKLNKAKLAVSTPSAREILKSEYPTIYHGYQSIVDNGRTHNLTVDLPQTQEWARSWTNRFRISSNEFFRMYINNF